jgi:hypothetical protein
MHLPRQRDAPNIPDIRSAFREHTANRLASGLPPVLGPLFGPQGSLHFHFFMRRGAGTHHSAVPIHQQRARSPGADVDA